MRALTMEELEHVSGGTIGSQLVTPEIWMQMNGHQYPSNHETIIVLAQSTSDMGGLMELWNGLTDGERLQFAGGVLGVSGGYLVLAASAPLWAKAIAAAVVGGALALAGLAADLVEQNRGG
jgi:hypothetical protein